MARPPWKVEVAVVEVALKVEAVARPKIERLPSNRELPETAKTAPGVEVAMPTRLDEVSTIKTLLLVVELRTSKAKAEEVEILKGSVNKREAYWPPRASKVVVPEASVEKAR